MLCRTTYRFIEKYINRRKRKTEDMKNCTFHDTVEFGYSLSLDLRKN